MPDTLEAQLEDVSEAALKERIELRKVKAAVDLYDRLLQAGENMQDQGILCDIMADLFWIIANECVLCRHISVFGRDQ